MMNNLHAPTVPSGPTSGAVANGNAGHLGFGELQRKKADLEEELTALGGVLESVCLALHDILERLSILTKSTSME